MKSIDDIEIDLEELERDRLQNERERLRMLDDYAAWLKERGIVKADRQAARGPKRPRKQGREPEG